MRATGLALRKGCAALVAAAMVVGLGLSESARALAVPSKVSHAPTCNTATPAMIKSALGIVVRTPRRSTAGKTFLCEYGSATSSLALVIQYNIAGSDSNYKTLRSGFDGNSEPTTSLRALGSLANEAFTATLGTGALAQHSVVALQKKLEVDVASYVGIPKLIVLMRRILIAS